MAVTQNNKNWEMDKITCSKTGYQESVSETASVLGSHT